MTSALYSIRRRQFFKMNAATAAMFAASRAQSAWAEAGNDDLNGLSATAACDAMRKGDIKAEDYAAALLKRCEAGKQLNPFISLDPVKVMEAARAADRQRVSGAYLGPLHGLPIPIKDSVNTKDLPTTAGTPALRNFRPKDDAPIVRTLYDAGAILLGKTNLHELSYSWTSTNLAFGAVRNPYDPTRIPGGSSGGTAVAVATGMAPLGVAEDTLGSIRVPAAMCGIAGFRPTTFRYSPLGIAPLTSVFDTAGPHARKVVDLALFDSAITGDFNPLPLGSLSGVRLGIPRAHYYAGLDSEVERVTDEALKRLRDAGAVLVEVDVPDLPKLWAAVTFPIIGHETVPMTSKYLEEFGTGITFEQLLAAASPDVKAILERFALPGGKDYPPQEAYDAARTTLRPALQQTFRKYFCETGVAAVVYPTTLVPPTPIGKDQEVEIGGEKVPFFVAMSRNIAPGSGAGIPGLVLPAGLTKAGLPVGVEFDGPSGSDRDLLALGVTLERALGPIAMPRL
jgi:Asp-tRNA(Asn)/Glu-tRNA(Gln) amidotransferase A subunit family amidase